VRGGEVARGSGDGDVFAAGEVRVMGDVAAVRGDAVGGGCGGGEGFEDGDGDG